LAKRGSKLVLWDIQAELLEETKRLVLDAAPRAVVRITVMNLAAREDIERETAALLEQADDPIDVIVNNAGVISGKYLTEVSPDRMELTMKINVLAHMHIVRAILPSMVSRDSGHIVAVTSVAGLIGASGMVDYAASKFGARGFCEALAIELHERKIHGVKVSCICPTLIDTGLFNGFYVPMNPTLKTIDVVNAIIDAVEYEQELVVLPAWLKVSTVLLKSVLMTMGYLGIKTPFDSPMKNFDDSQAERAFRAISAGQSRL